MDIEYVISKNYRFDDIRIFLFNKGYSVCTFNSGDNHFLINDTSKSILLLSRIMFVFLEYFTKPNTIDNVISDYSEKINCESCQIEGVFNSFFNEMRTHGVLVKDCL